jgi:hypothetical protein
MTIWIPIWIFSKSGEFGPILAMKNPLYRLKSYFFRSTFGEISPNKKETPSCPGPDGVQKVVLLGVGAGDSLIEHTEPLKPNSIWTMSPAAVKFVSTETASCSFEI